MPRTTPLECIRNIGIMAHLDAGKTATTERILYYTGRTNKMDRVGADFEMCLKMVRERLGGNVVPIHLPLGSGELFTGLIDLIRQVEIVYDDASLGKKYVEGPVPAALREKVAEMRHHLLEAVVEQDDAILHKYLEEHELTEDEIRTVLRKATISGKVVPVLSGAAFKNKGVQALRDAVVDYLPCPLDVPAIQGHVPHGDTLSDESHPIILEAMKFPEPVISVAIEPKTKADQDKLSISLQKLSEEDPTFRVHSDAETGQTIISGMGELHLEIIVDRMKREFNVEANVGRPQVAYRETIRKKAEAEGKYIKQTGGRGQYGHCKLEVHPLPSADHENMHEMSTDELDALAKQIAGAGGKWKFDKEHRFLFIDKVFGGAIPREFIPPIEAGIREAMDSGTLAGFMMVDVAVILVDGSYHDVDSSEMAFKIAGSMGFKEACAKAKPVLLEPIMKVEVVVPEEYMAAVFGDLNSRRAHIQGSETRAGSNVIRVQVPLAEMFGYATDLRSRSQGRGNFTMHFSHYAEVPNNLAEEIIKKARGGK